MSATPQTICWTCAKACGGCRWSRYKVQQPVPGWTAIPTKVGMQINSHGRIRRGRIDSFIVLACPEYVQDGGRDVKSND